MLGKDVGLAFQIVGAPSCEHPVGSYGAFDGGRILQLL